MREIAIAFVICSILAAVASAGPNENAKVAIHVLAYNAKRSCTKEFPVINSCSDIITTYPGTNVHFFPVFFDVVECTAVQYGVTWEGESCTFKSCSDLVIGGLVNPGDGAAHAWTTCKSGPVCIPSFGWITSYGLISIVPGIIVNQETGDTIVVEPAMVDCGDERVMDSLPPEAWGFAGTNGLEGCQPCSLSVEPTTWGQIKALFR